MKFKNLAFLLMFISFACNAQIFVGTGTLERKINFDKSDYAALKGRTTIFVIDDFTVAEFESMLKGVWEITPYKVITGTEFKKEKSKYITDQNAIFQMASTVTSFRSSSNYEISHSYFLFYYYYPVDIKMKKGKPDFDDKGVAGILMHGSGFNASPPLSKASEMGKKEDFTGAADAFYAYRLGYLRNNLTFINNTIASGKEVDGNKGEVVEPRLKELATVTLYVPESFKTNPRIWKGFYRAEFQQRVSDEAVKAFDDYKHKYEFINDEELDKKLLEGKEKFYYLTYTMMGPYHIASIVDSQTGETIYRSSKLHPYDLETFTTDISKKISKAVKK